MNRLLIVTERFWPEDFIINDLASELVRSGMDVTVLTQQPSYPKGRIMDKRRNAAFSSEIWQGVRILRFKTVLGYRESMFFKCLNYAWFAFVGSFWVLALRLRADKVFIYQTGPLTLAIPGILKAKLADKPSVIWTQDLWPDSVFDYGFRKTNLLSWALDRFVGWVYRSVNLVLISSEGFRHVISRFTAAPIVYAPNWPLTEFESSNMPRGSAEGPTFVFAGNIGRLQNLENVVKGFRAAVRRDPSVGRLRIVGDGSSLGRVREAVVGDGSPVEFCGRIPASAMGEQYEKADFLVMPLADSPAARLVVPSKFQTYLHVGKPILCIASGEAARLVRDFGLGVVCAPEDPEAIARGFEAMSSAPKAQRDEWCANARKALREHYDRHILITRIRQALSAPDAPDSVSISSTFNDSNAKLTLNGPA